jgi:hypothetical protein
MSKTSKIAPSVATPLGSVKSKNKIIDIGRLNLSKASLSKVNETLEPPSDDDDIF